VVVADEFAMDEFVPGVGDGRLDGVTGVVVFERPRGGDGRDRHADLVQVGGVVVVVRVVAVVVVALVVVPVLVVSEPLVTVVVVAVSVVVVAVSVVVISLNVVSVGLLPWVLVLTHAPR